MLSFVRGETDHEVRPHFIEHYDAKLSDFAKNMADAFSRWQTLDSSVSTTIDGAHLSSVVFTSFNSLAVSMKLVVDGLLPQAGNAKRQALEGLALALLFTQPSTQVLPRWKDGKYTTNKAIRDVKRHAKRLSADEAALDILEENASWHDRYSHPSAIGIANTMSFASKQMIFLGGHFDSGKLFAYDKEINSRVGLSAILSNYVDLVEFNLAHPAP